MGNECGLKINAEFRKCRARFSAVFSNLFVVVVGKWGIERSFIQLIASVLIVFEKGGALACFNVIISGIIFIKI